MQGAGQVFKPYGTRLPQKELTNLKEEKSADWESQTQTMMRSVKLGKVEKQGANDEAYQQKVEAYRSRWTSEKGQQPRFSTTNQTANSWYKK